MPARPVLRTVDDAPSVSRAIAGRPAPLPDHRMPGMTGVECREQAMDLVPAATRVLLTADTDAAIRPFDHVDLDHHLLEPPGRPEEQLHPVPDELLEARERTARAPCEGRVLLGHRWSADTRQRKEFLARHQAPFHYLQGADVGIRRAAELTDDARLPATVCSDDGAVLVEVTDDGPEVREAVREHASEPFVTTRAPGEGSGPGLDDARRIVERRHGGRWAPRPGPAGSTSCCRPGGRR